ncbi:hypothetical protein MTX78_22940 [Hymenobacter tibetensis]|uniref:Uncharacterized protein n=1 Tax=Hymenobacter tibetensis TaxID=497967 RepID=A0ABY4CXG3_9BACT|nr:hypothetical protein [Hymenobacter tibetensis]UOG74959.1 hypothetical protein MTX78_22940 [Hymenobacter tibetensis]
MSYIVTPPNGSILLPEPIVAAAEANQIHDRLQVWFLKHARKATVAIPGETAKPVTAMQSDAVWARSLAASEKSALVVVTHVYHQRIFHGALQQVQAVAAESTTPATVTLVPTASGFIEEVRVDLTVYRATGEVVSKHTERGTPGFFQPSSGYVTDHLVKKALKAMPRLRKAGA